MKKQKHVNMGNKIKTIPKERIKGIKEMSPYMVDELVLLGHHLLNVKEGE